MTRFYQHLQLLTLFFSCGDFNGHIGCLAAGYEGLHSSFGFGDGKTGGKQVLEYAESVDLVVCNTVPEKIKLLGPILF